MICRAADMLYDADTLMLPLLLLLRDAAFHTRHYDITRFHFHYDITLSC